MITHDLTPTRPDYAGGSIVNLMSSIGEALGAAPSGYAPLRLLPVEVARDARRIALVVIDGLGAELLNHLGTESALLAHCTDHMTSVYPPTTASAITSFMSGLAPQQHALTGWFMHFRRLGAVTAVLPFVARYTRSPLRRQGIDPAALIDAPSFASRVACETAMLQPDELADSDFSRLLGAGARRDGYRGLDDFAARLAAFVRGDDATRYLYAYWPELDRLSHLHGPSSPAVAAHFQALDRALGALLKAAKDNGTLLIITADHGFVDSTPAERIDIGPQSALAQALSLPLCGEPRSAYAYVQADRQADFLGLAQQTLGDHARTVPSQQLIDDGWFGLGTPHPELKPRIGDFVIQMNGTASIRDRVVGEREFDMYGQHGGISAAEQRVPFICIRP